MDILRHRQYDSHARFPQTLALLIALLTASFGTARDAKEHLPVITAATVPLYPALARLAHIDGTVRLRISTDGEKVSVIQIESGQPMLAQAAEENAKTWHYKKHAPITFQTTFQYKLLSETECEMDSGTVLLRLPTVVEISAKGVRTCDPSESIR